MDRTVFVASGMPYAGKSTILNRVLEAPYAKGATLVRMDDIRKKLYGDRGDTHVTKSEHLYKNEKVRNAILEALVLGAPMVATEAVMLTEKGHQKPFLDMVARADAYVKAIEAEARVRDELPEPATPSSVKPKVVLLYAATEVIVDRANRSMEERRKSNASIFDLTGIRGALEQFEFPLLYQPLLIDTSDESELGLGKCLVEIDSFILETLEQSEDVFKQRKAEFVRSWEELKKIVIG